NGVSFAKKRGMKMIIQSEGYADLFGLKQEGCSYETSLCAAYKATGAAVLPVFITAKKYNAGFNILPEAAYQALPGSVIIDGLAEDEFGSGETEVETAFIRKLHEHSGIPPTRHDMTARKEKYRKLARTDADQILSEFNA